MFNTGRKLVGKHTSVERERYGERFLDVVIVVNTMLWNVCIIYCTNMHTYC